MKYIKFFLSVSFLVLIAANVILTGCGKNINLSDTGYTPGASVRNITEYKDAEISLGGFTNNAAKTKRYAYFSADKSVSYSTNSLLPDYMWYCFEKAFKNIGMRVNEADEAPSLYIIINEMLDTGIKFDLNLYKGDELLHAREVTVSMPEAPSAKEADPALLEKNAYNMMDSAFASVVNDPDFRKNIIKAPSGAKPASPEKKTAGTLVGIVKAVDVPGNEIIIGSGKIASMVNIGDTVYAVIDGQKIVMEINFPMQTIAKCKVCQKDIKNISKLQKGDMVYK